MDINLRGDWISPIESRQPRRPPLVELYFPIAEGAQLYKELHDSMNKSRQNFSLCFPDATIKIAGIVTRLSAPDRNGFITGLIQTTARGE
jgi:hypothetical protein